MEAIQRYDTTQHAVEPAHSYDEIVNHVALVQKVYSEIMQKDQHYGVIPGTGNKPSLLKPGAEKLAFAFKLAPTFKIDRRELRGDHVEYEIVCTLVFRPTGELIGEGVGICSSMESKYRYRNAKPTCPTCGAQAISRSKAEYGGGYYCNKRADGCGAKFKKGDQAIESQPTGKIENPDIADQFNTVIKMAKKRAFVDAIITCTAASDIFTQDVEDMVEVKQEEATRQPERRRASMPQSAPPPIDYDAKIKNTRVWLKGKLKEGPEAVSAARDKALGLLADWPQAERKRAVEVIESFSSDDPGGEEAAHESGADEFAETPDFFQEQEG